MLTITDRLKVWGSDIDPGTINQALLASKLPVVEGHVALMPDAHVGIGCTIGSVTPTKGAIIAAAVGVDIGCGVVAAQLGITANQLPDDLGPMLSLIESVVPAGVGKSHQHVSGAAERFMAEHRNLATELTNKQESTALTQFGTLGAGNHFCEICLDENDSVWVMLHSGSRGIGNQLAQSHIKTARGLANQLEYKLEDPDLAWFVEGTPEFKAYVQDLLWAQAYARANRDQMMTSALKVVRQAIGDESIPEVTRINAHHNFAQQEVHGDQLLWITRKGAIQADKGRMGIIPGSMGTKSYIVRGLGNPESWNSCSHGAGRKYSRSKAKQVFTTDDFAKQMEGRTWQSGRADALLDEIPSAYKDVEQVMRDQADLVEVVHTLRQVLNYKGV